MYEKWKTVMFGDTEVTIYKNMTGEYFAEYEDGYQKTKIPCGNDWMFLWEHLSSELGEDESPTGEDLLMIADAVEQKFPVSTTEVDLVVAIEDYLFNAKKLYPAYVCDEVLSVLKYRYAYFAGTKLEYKKLLDIASLAEWLQDAILTKRIYRLNTSCNDVIEYSDDAVRIKGAYQASADYMVEFEILYATEEEADDCGNTRQVWKSDCTVVLPLSRCTLKHRREDELPPEYIEEW